MSEMKWKTPEELQERIESYWGYCEDKNEYPTISGLAWWLKTNRQTLLNYENAEDNGWLSRLDSDTKRVYVDTIKEAKAKIESGYEQALFNKNSNVGAIFTLKNNYKWVDKTEVEQTTKEIKVELVED